MIDLVLVFCFLLAMYAAYKRFSALFVFSTFSLLYLALRPKLLSVGVYSKFSYVNDLISTPLFQYLDDLAAWILINMVFVLLAYCLTFLTALKSTFGMKRIGFYIICSHVALQFIAYKIGVIPYYVLLTLLLLITSYLVLEKRWRESIFFLIPTLFVLTLSEDRRDWLMVIYIAVFLYAFTYRKVSILKLAVYGMLSFLFVVYIAVALRTNGLVDFKSVAERLSDSEKTVSVIEVETDFSIVYDDLLILYSELEQNNIDYLYGLTLLKPLYSFVPRSIWEDKPETISRIYSKVVNPDFYQRGGSQPLTFIGEAFWNLGFFGIVLSVLIGVYIGALDSILSMARRQKNSLYVALVFVLSAACFHILRGPLDSFWLVHVFTLFNFFMLILTSRLSYR